MDIMTFKLVSFVACTLVGGFGLLPLATRGWEQRDRYLSLSNALAGGVFLGAGFVHLLFEATNVYTFELMGGSHDIFPLSFVLCPVGFLLTLYIEKVMCAGRMDEPGQSGVEMEEQGHVAQSHGGSGHSHDHGALAVLNAGSGRFFPVIIMFVLSIHSFLSGMALGVSKSVVQAGVVLLAILSHKWIEFFALGVSILKSGASAGALVKMILCCSMMTPAGILVGGMLEAALDGYTGLMLTFILTSISSGTFLYIAVVDILMEEFSIPGDKEKNTKFLLCCLGFTMMIVASVMFDDEHSHGSSDA